MYNNSFDTICHYDTQEGKEEWILANHNAL